MKHLAATFEKNIETQYDKVQADFAAFKGFVENVDSSYEGANDVRMVTDRINVVHRQLADTMLEIEEIIDYLERRKTEIERMTAFSQKLKDDYGIGKSRIEKAL